MLKTAQITDIQAAALTPDNIKARSLQGYSAARNRFKRAYSMPGGFCVSIKMEKQGATAKCMRCWHKEPNDDNMMNRLASIAKAINDRRREIGEYFIDYEKVDEIIDVKGVKLPGLIMDWIDAQTLEEYISRDNDSVGPNDMMSLAKKFREMCVKMNKAKISHGDLSGGNIMVLTAPLRLKLIDYDSVYVESMGRLPETTTGDAKYQHPGRKLQNTATLGADNFSQHLIYVTLLMLSRDMTLRVDADKSLFKQTDLASRADFVASQPYRKGIAMRDADITAELQLLAAALDGKYLDVPPLKEASHAYVETPKPEPQRVVETPKPEPQRVVETPKPSPTVKPQPKPATKPAVRTIYADFCTNCGKRFPTSDSANNQYCLVCGHKRLSYTTKS